MIRRVAPLALMLAFAAGPAPAEDAGPKTVTKIELGAADLTPLAAFPGVSNAFLIGEFAEAGLYAAEGEMAAGSAFPPHTHPDARLTIVLSGTMYLGEGETADPGRLVAYPAGTAAITPAGAAHYMAALDGDVRVLEIGAGPSGLTLIERSAD
ncbi:MAG: cupin domain-containing protein [Pseudomonadota bacterium]